MKNKFGFISLVLTLLLIVINVVPMRSMAASQLPVDLGSTSTFAVLAGSTITNTGTTTISGNAGSDIGLSPGTEFTGQASVSVSGGAIYLADAKALQAKDDLIIAFNDVDSRLPVTRISSELGGKTLTPGIYDSADGSFQITGTLTLDGQGDPNSVFIFKTASTLITASGSNVNLINSARFCNVYWKVGSSATLGTNSLIGGHILAMISITANNGATVIGQLLTQTGAITLENNIIRNIICPTVLSPIPTGTPTPTGGLEPIPTGTPTPTPTGGLEPIQESTPTPTPTGELEPIQESTPTPTPSVPTTTIEEPTLTPTPPEETTEELPKTGTFPTEVLLGLGTLLTGTGLYLKKKK